MYQDESKQSRVDPKEIVGLSFSQPWLEWMLLRSDGFEWMKDVENRNWERSYRGLVVLHAAKSWDDEAFDFLDMHGIKLPSGVSRNQEDYQRGGIVGVATLAEIVRTGKPDPNGIMKSKWFFGTYGWRFENMRRTEFIPMGGSLGLWKVSPDIIKRLGIKQTDPAPEGQQTLF